MNEGLVFKKTRIAPTPSCYLHLGNVLSFAISAALAKRTGAKILLRIDDFDMERTKKEFVQDIFDTLNFMEIPWDEGPRNLQEYEQEYSMVHRMGIYNDALEKLKNNGDLFACSCSRTQLHAHHGDMAYEGACRLKNIAFEAENVKWRVLTSDQKMIYVKTLGGQVMETTLPESMQDFFVRKKDRFPAYQLISLMDDVYFGVDLVVRGEDLWDSTLAQLYLASLLKLDAFLNTTFYHHPLLMAPDGHKLSKSLGATSVQHWRKEHKKNPADIYSMIAGMLGFETPVANWEELVGLIGMDIGVHSGGDKIIG